MHYRVGHAEQAVDAKHDALFRDVALEPLCLGEMIQRFVESYPILLRQTAFSVAVQISAGAINSGLMRPTRRPIRFSGGVLLGRIATSASRLLRLKKAFDMVSCN